MAFEKSLRAVRQSGKLGEGSPSFKWSFKRIPETGNQTDSLWVLSGDTTNENCDKLVKLMALIGADAPSGALNSHTLGVKGNYAHHWY